jgi:hypothetical protein
MIQRRRRSAFSTARGTFPQIHFKLLMGMARPERFELPAYWFEASRSIQVSYGRSIG